MRSPPLAAALLCFLIFIGRAPGTPVDSTNFAESTFISNANLGLPTGIAWAPDGSNRLFVIRKGGEVRVVYYNPATRTGSIDPLFSTAVPPAWATISPVYTNSECGLIGFCFDPDFINNRYVYFFVTVAGDNVNLTGEQQIIRYTDNPGAATGTNKTILVAGLPSRGVNHDGGGIGIGPDGRLYWSIGDNANYTGADNDLISLAAKVGRANRLTGAAPNDNPFFDGAGTNNDYIWARGFRNPFTMAFQPGTGKLWLNVVGSSPTGETQPNSGPGYEQIFVVTRGVHGGWNDYENNQPAGYLRPLIAYRVNGTTAVNLTAAGAARSGGIITITTSSFHPFRQGAKVTVAGVVNTSFNGSFYVASRINDTQFTVAQAGADETSGGGTATTQSIGGSVTGGCFYDSTAYSAAYRGNFFFGDVNTGNFVRATLDANDVPTSVDLFVTGSGTQVDTCVGPDGALYLAQHTNSRINRVATTSTAQNVFVHPTAFHVAEGGSAVFTVRLAQMPGGNVTVNLAKISGDADLNVSGSTSLTFTASNWNLLQTVTISAGEDADFDSGSAVFQLSSTGLPTYDVNVAEMDNDEPALVVSRANLNIVETFSGTFTVHLTTAPTAPVNVTVERLSGDSDISVTGGATLNFDSGNFSTPQTVTIVAAADADRVDDTAVISITRPGEPVRMVNVTGLDDVPPTFTSTAKTTAVVNQPYSYDVETMAHPAPTYTLPTRPVGMQIDASTGLITWTSSATGNFNVTVRASNGLTPDATQAYTLVVGPDNPPTANLTSPANGAVLNGPSAEFFGDGVDDAGTVKGEFFVDGILRYTDTNSGAHYHFGGSHALFDTEQFSNGPHTLLFRVTDAIGQAASAQVEVTIGNGADAWRAQHFNLSNPTDLANSALLADPDGDALKNIFKYGTDSAPKTPSLARLPVQKVANVGGVDYLALEFVMAKWATDLQFRVEVTGILDGSPWTQIDPADLTYRVSALDNVPSFGLTTVTVRDVVPKGSAPRFIRLRVTK